MVAALELDSICRNPGFWSNVTTWQHCLLIAFMSEKCQIRKIIKTDLAKTVWFWYFLVTLMISVFSILNVQILAVISYLHFSNQYWHWVSLVLMMLHFFLRFCQTSGFSWWVIVIPKFCLVLVLSDLWFWASTKILTISDAGVHFGCQVLSDII